MLVGALTPSAVALDRSAGVPLVDSRARRRATVRRARAARAERRRRRDPGRAAARARRRGSARSRCSTSSGWASSRSASSSACRCCSTSASCTRRLRARQAPARRRPRARRRARCSRSSCRSWLLGNLVGNRGPLFFRQPRTGRERREFEILKFRTMTRRRHADAARRSRRSSGPADHPVRSAPAAHASRRAPAGGQHPARRPVGRRAPARAAAPRRRARRQDPVLPAPAPRAPRPHRLGPGEVPLRGHDDADALEKLQYEFFYLRRQSLGLDLRIVGRTVRIGAPRGRRPMTGSPRAPSSSLRLTRREAIGDCLEPLRRAGLRGSIGSRCSLVDGGATDGTGDVAQRFCLRAAPAGLLTVLDGPVGTYAGEPQRGLALVARGEFLCRVDARSRSRRLRRTCVEILSAPPGGQRARWHRRSRWPAPGGRRRGTYRSCPEQSVRHGPRPLPARRSERRHRHGLPRARSAPSSLRAGAVGTRLGDEPGLRAQPSPGGNKASSGSRPGCRSGMCLGLHGPLYPRQYHRFGHWKVRYWRALGRPPRPRQVPLSFCLRSRRPAAPSPWCVAGLRTAVLAAEWCGGDRPPGCPEHRRSPAPSAPHSRSPALHRHHQRGWSERRRHRSAVALYGEASPSYSSSVAGGNPRRPSCAARQRHWSAPASTCGRGRSSLRVC